MRGGQNNMGLVEITSRTAWMTTVLLGAQASLGLLLVRGLPAAGNSLRSPRTWVLTVHAVIGLVLPPLALSHGWFSMKLPGIRATGMAGLGIATFARLLLAMQAMTGIAMLRLREARRTAIRRQHFAMAVLLALLAGAHVFLNR